MAAAVGAFALWPAESESPPDVPTPHEVRTARGSAQKACAAATTFEQLIRDNAPSDTVLATLGDAVAAADAAAGIDPFWVALEGGLRSLESSLRTDDAAAASVGIRVVRAECDKLRD